jgi:hypothetical protein
MLIKNQQKLNEYDYKSMMKNFESESRHKKFLNGIKNKWRAISCRYKEKVAFIKIKNEKLNKMRDRAFKKKYLQKENAIKNQLEQKKFEKLEAKRKLAEIIKKKNEDAAKNLEKFHKMQEEERLKLEEDTFQKSI